LKRALFRLLILAGFLVYAALLAMAVASDWYENHPSIEHPNRGLHWMPGNAALWTAYARYWLYSGEPGRAIEPFTRSVALNPIDPANWDGLASAYLRQWDSPKAEAALRAWLTVLPHSPRAEWRLGNFLVIEERSSEALPYLKDAATGDPTLDEALFDLAWKMVADPAVILRDLVPASASVLEDYLQFLMDRKMLTEAAQVWPEVRAARDQRASALGNLYVDALFWDHKADDAAKVWAEILADSGRTSAKPPGELITNGDFEAGLPNAGLDWRMVPGPGYREGLDDNVAQSGTQSFQVSFDGSSNTDFSGLVQWVPVEAAHDYRFSAFLKTDRITTDNGLRFSIATIGDAPGERGVFLTENQVGSNPWTQEQLDFRTGPTTHMAIVTLRRFASGKLNNLIQGRVWVDNVSIKARR